MNVKNTTTESYAINKLVQINLSTPDENDGYLLANQTLDLIDSLTVLDIMESEQLKEGIYNGSLIFVVDGIEVEGTRNVEIYESGPTQWARIFNPVISKSNLYEGLAGGFIYAKNCLIG